MTEEQGEYKVPAVVEGLILIILDADLARIYGVQTETLERTG